MMMMMMNADLYLRRTVRPCRRFADSEYVYSSLLTSHLISSHLYLTHGNKYKNIRGSYECVIWAGQKRQRSRTNDCQSKMKKLLHIRTVTHSNQYKLGEVVTARQQQLEAFV